MLGGGGGERGGGRVVGGALGCQFPATAGLGGRVLLGGLRVSRAGAVELSFKAACAAEDLPDPDGGAGAKSPMPGQAVARRADPGRTAGRCQSAAGRGT